MGEKLVDVGLGGADELGELPLVFGAMGDDEAGKFIHWHKFIVGAATGDLLLFAVIWVALVEDVAEAGLGVGELFVEGDELFVVGKVFFDADVIADAEAFELACEVELDDLDAAAFCTLTKDQQIARFSPSGLGRMTVNAGESRSCGAELGLT